MLLVIARLIMFLNVTIQKIVVELGTKSKVAILLDLLDLVSSQPSK